VRPGGEAVREGRLPSSVSGDMKTKKPRQQHKPRQAVVLLAFELSAKKGGAMRHKNDRRAKDARRDETRGRDD